MYSVFNDRALSNADPGSNLISCSGKGFIKSSRVAESLTKAAKHRNTENLGTDMAADQTRCRMQHMLSKDLNPSIFSTGMHRPTIFVDMC
jgi:hypothetical protein